MSTPLAPASLDVATIVPLGSSHFALAAPSAPIAAEIRALANRVVVGVDAK